MGFQLRLAERTGEALENIHSDFVQHEGANLDVYAFLVGAIVLTIRGFWSNGPTQSVGFGLASLALLELLRHRHSKQRLADRLDEVHQLLSGVLDSQRSVERAVNDPQLASLVSRLRPLEELQADTPRRIARRSSR